MINNNLPNFGICECGALLDQNGICSCGSECKKHKVYENGWRTPIKTEQYPIEEEEE